MRDLNFFEPFLDKKSFKFNKMIILYALVISSIAIISLFAIYNQLQLNKLKKEVSELRVAAENPKLVAKAQEIREFEEEKNQFKEEVEKIVALDQEIQARDTIGTNLLFDINQKLPEGVFITNISSYETSSQISGYAQDKYSIAEFAKGLATLKEGNKVFVSNISSVEEFYKFDLTIEKEEVSLDANEG